MRKNDKADRPYPPEKFIIALTGGIASGKSAAAEILRKLGAGIVDADVIAREIVEPGKPALKKIREIWGEKIINIDGTLNRSALADIIFSDEKERKKLNSILHPEIRKELVKKASECKENIVALIIPLLYEAKEPVFYDESWLVYSKPADQKDRLMKRNNLSEEEARKRIDSQLPIDKKRELADVIIDNTRDFKYLEDQIKKEWNKIEKR